MNHGRLSLPLISILTIFSFVLLLTTVFTHRVESAINHVVISEIQLRGAQPIDEFIELYNPTDTDIDISGWRLAKKTATISAVPQTLVHSLTGVIPSRGYFLIAHPAFLTISTTPDQVYSATSSSIAVNNTILLYSDAGQTIIDKVGLGSAADNENQTVENPADNGSVERKALNTSTAESMDTGGLDENKGNGWDSDNNMNDFILRPVSYPQNRLSDKEPSPAPTDTPTLMPTEEPTTTPEPTVSLTPEPSPSPTDIPSPTEIPSVTPTHSPSPTSTPEPTETTEPTPTVTETPFPTDEPTPSVSPSPTDVPTLTPTPTISFTPTPTLSPTPPSTPTPTLVTVPTPKLIGQYVFPRKTISCYLQFRPITTKYISLFIPHLVCR